MSTQSSGEKIQFILDNSLYDLNDLAIVLNCPAILLEQYLEIALQLPRGFDDELHKLYMMLCRCFTRSDVDVQLP